ncbi:short chain dehydrogenase [Hamiltosporidium magnivora]|uniref:Short chain dehydrogenase n=1 Tax=Hamiltosporidium magnivora TaxID=148818 RepID=A0A4Q9LPD0_9MICR|nr:short chain dehydrogenase [Hamiltosporidium magnivora]
MKLTECFIRIYNSKLPQIMKISLIGICESIRNIFTFNSRKKIFEIEFANEEINVVITGGNKGIGKEITLLLVKHNYNVHILARDKSSLEEIKYYCDKIQKNKCFYTECDLSNPRSIKSAASTVFKNKKIHLIINNAGILEPSIKYRNNIEINFFINHLGHFILFKELERRICAIRGRVVNVTSCAIYSVDEYFTAKNPFFSFMKLYSESKLCNSLFSLAIKNMSGIRSVAIHPGIIATNLFDRSFYGYFVWLTTKLASRFLVTTQEAANVVINACFTHEIYSENEKCDLFIGYDKGIIPKSLNVDNSRKLWNLSEYLYQKLERNDD